MSKDKITKYLKYTCIVLFLLFFLSFWSNEKLSANTDISKTTEITEEDKKVISDFLQILKDPNKISAITNSIESQETVVINKDVVNNPLDVLPKEQLRSLDDNFKSLFYFIYQKYKNLEIGRQFYKYYNDLIEDIYNLNYQYLFILFFVTSLYSITLLVLDYFYSKFYGVSHYIKDFTRYKKKKNLIKNHIFLFFINIKLFLPIIIPPFLIAELVKINVYYINYGLIPESIINIIIFFVVLQLLLKFLQLVFYNTNKKILLKLKLWITILLYYVYIFLCFSSIYLILENYALVKLNVILFGCISLLSALKFRLFFKKINIKEVKETLHSYKRLSISIQKYSVTFFYILAYFYLVSILFLDPSITKSVIVRILLVIMGMMFIYLIQSYIGTLISNKIVLKIENKSQKVLKIAFNKTNLQIINLNVFWKFFKIIYRVGFIFLYLKFFDKMFETTYLSSLMELSSYYIVQIILSTLLAFCLLIIITFIIVLFIEKYLYNVALSGDVPNLRKILTLYKIIQKPYKILFIIILLVSTISFFGISLPALLASTGILTVLVAFGMKDILQNLFNSIIFLLENSFALNDLIELNGKLGVVEEISMVYVKIRDSSGNLVMTPFKNISVIVNCTKDYSYASVEVGVAYGSDIDKVFETLKDIGKEMQSDPELKDLIISIIEIGGVIGLADSSVNVVCKIKTIAGSQFKVRAVLYKKIHQKFMEENIDIPFPQRVITINKETN